MMASRIGLTVFALSMLVKSAMANNNHHLFLISKSQNKNQVHYAIQLDAQCQPLSPTPVYAYWLMLEKDPHITEGLLDREQPAYGIGKQTVNHNQVTFTLNAIPSKTVTISNTLQSGKCASQATTTIDNQLAVIQSVHVELWLFGVKKITVYGHTVKDHTKVEEVIK